VAGGVSQNACEFQSKGELITNLVEDMATEQKTRITYDNIPCVTKDTEIGDLIHFLREDDIFFGDLEQH
jgi:spore coat protein JC